MSDTRPGWRGVQVYRVYDYECNHCGRGEETLPTFCLTNVLRDLREKKHD
jgi:hypothetical protein